MKRAVAGIAAVALILLAAPVAAQTISGSAHDFSAELWNTTGEICVVCHTPHNADGTVADAPLWNHQVTSQTFTVYSSSTLDATVGQPDGSSKLCLSCHDGITAVDNYGSRTTGSELITGDPNLTDDISDDHPVSFTWGAGFGDADIYDPTTQSSGLGGTIDEDMLIGGKLQCASCHDVHNGSGVANLLLKSNAASALCLTCHIK